ncbi:MAG: translation initiation factor IF-2 subunit beta [Nanoarchaeota archaeon]
MDYEKMLDRGIESLPESTKKSERFEIPRVLGHIQGNKTIISNFGAIAQVLHREAGHVLKYILKELATPGELQSGRMVIGRKVSASKINTKIESYAQQYVICQECKRPDTQLEKKGTITLMKCAACGATRPINAKI